MGLHIRWLIRRDMPEVLQMEQDSFPLPWSEEDFLRTLRQRNCIGMVAETADRVLGYMLYELEKHHLHILNFAVHPQHRRQGIGAQLVRKLCSKLSSHRRTRLTATLSEANLPAQLFFRSQGFRCESLARQWYDDGQDAYHFVWRLPVSLDDYMPLELDPTNRVSPYLENLS